MFGTDEGWPSRLLPTPKQWLKAFAFTIFIIAVLVAKAAYATSNSASASAKPMIEVHLPKGPASVGSHLITIVLLEDVHVRN